MARPRKTGLEYFPLDCQMDGKVAMLEAEHDLAGFAVYIKFLQEIYQTENGELDMSIVFRWKTLGKQWGIPVDDLRSMLETMFAVGLFDRKIFEERQVLTSEGIKKRIGKVANERQKDRSRKDGEFSDGKPPENGGNRKGNRKGNSVETEDSADPPEGGPRTGGDDEPPDQEPDDSPSPDDPVFITFTLNTGREYPLTEGQVGTFQELYPAVDVRQELRGIKAWCISNPKNRKTSEGAMKFVNTWLSKAQNNGGTGYRPINPSNGSTNGNPRTPYNGLRTDPLKIDR